MYLINLLYIMSFGSFIGYSAAFPLLLTQQFPEVQALKFAFIGPLLSSIFRTIGGFAADKFGGAIISFLAVLLMIFGVGGVIYFIGNDPSFVGFFLMFMVLFISGGIVNGSIFRMIPIIFGPKETSAAIGFCSAIGAFGGFFIPKMFGYSIDMTGSAQGALFIFMAYYLFCAIILWYFYTRPEAEIKC